MITDRQVFFLYIFGHYVTVLTPHRKVCATRQCKQMTLDNSLYKNKYYISLHIYIFHYSNLLETVYAIWISSTCHSLSLNNNSCSLYLVLPAPLNVTS